MHYLNKFLKQNTVNPGWFLAERQQKTQLLAGSGGRGCEQAEHTGF
jgi:hypothetical protein